jgi:hypothetical protein
MRVIHSKRRETQEIILGLSIVLCLLVLAFIGCDTTNTKGMCRDFEQCEGDKCWNIRIWYECDLETQEQCEWQEFDKERVASNDEAIPCEFCDYRQCPED